MIIGISWRNDGDGKGAAWDHFTLQTIFGVETFIVADANERGACRQKLRDFMVTQNFAFP